MSTEIKNLFSKIANKYDSINFLMSLGLHKKWEKNLVSYFKSTGILLDLCAGTGSISKIFLKKHPNNQAILIDFCNEMLDEAKKKLSIEKSRVNYFCLDVSSLPLSDNSYDFISLSYGLRNLSDPLNTLKEAYRVLKPKGTIGILELTRPKKPFLQTLHGCYINSFLAWGRLIAKDYKAYKYLIHSIKNFSDRAYISKMISAQNFKIKEQRLFLSGAATLWIAEKN